MCYSKGLPKKKSGRVVVQHTKRKHFSVYDKITGKSSDGFDTLSFAESGYFRVDLDLGEVSIRSCTPLELF